MTWRGLASLIRTCFATANLSPESLSVWGTLPENVTYDK